MTDEVSLLVNGREYGGWTEVNISRALDAIAGAFAISLVERWAGSGRVQAQVEPWPILNGDECQLKIGKDVIIDGYVDQFRPSFSSTSHTIEIQGRDRTGDLVDCTALHKPDQWSNIDLLQFAKIICAPFKIKVSTDVDVGPVFPSIKLQQSETAFSALDRLTRFRKLLLTADGNGGVLITRAGTGRATVALVQGKNILSASGVLDTSERFSKYVVKGQNTSSLTVDGVAETHIESDVGDAGVQRYRPLVLMAESGSTAATAKERAIWEANVRLGRSATAQVTVAGWRQTPGGKLWVPNLRVPMDVPWLRMKGDMLVRQVVYRRNDQGTLVDLSLVSPQAFSPEPPNTAAAKTANATKPGSKNIWREALGEDEKPSS